MSSYKTIVLMLGIVLCIGISCDIQTQSSAPQGKQREAASFRALECTILNPDGSPAVKRKILLIPIERVYMTRYIEKGSANRKNWNFISDQQGHFAVKIWNIPYSKGFDSELPGEGTYYLISNPTSSDAGAVSVRLTTRKEDLWPANEWGKAQVIPVEGMRLAMQVQNGVTVRGRVVDYEHLDKPLSMAVYCSNDLRPDTHTGFGGEIFRQRADTDETGQFELHHVYPAKSKLSLVAFAKDGRFVQYNWLKTKLGENWLDECVNEISPRPDQTKLDIQIKATAKNLFRYAGRVTDAHTGHPIPDATIIFYHNIHRSVNSWTWEESHEDLRTQTNEEGIYEMMLPNPWQHVINVEKAGYQQKELYNEQDVFVPGNYDFSLTPN